MSLAEKETGAIKHAGKKWGGGEKNIESCKTNAG